MFYLHHISHFLGSGNLFFLAFHFTAISNGTGDAKGKKSILSKNQIWHKAHRYERNLFTRWWRKEKKAATRKNPTPSEKRGTETPDLPLQGQTDKTARNREGRVFGNTGTGESHHLFNSYRDVPSPDKKARQEGNRKKRGRRLHRCCSRGLRHGFFLGKNDW